MRAVGVEGVEEMGCGVATHSRQLVWSQRERTSGLRGKNGERGGSKDTRARGLKEGGDG